MDGAVSTDPRRDDQDVRALIGMQSPAARGLVAFYAATFALLAVASRDGIDTFWPVALGVAVVSMCAVILVRMPGDPLPLGSTWALTASGPVTCALVFSVLPVPVTSPMQTWPIAAVTVLYTFMGVRGRTWYAWLGLAATILTCVVWTTLTGRGAVAGVAMSIINLAPLAMSAFFAYTVRPSAADIFALREQTTAQVAAEAADTAVLDERDRQLRRLDAQARPLLDRIASGDPLSDDERLTCRLLEAHLRDSVRAPALIDPAVVDAARAARARGVEVILLDDHAADDADDATRRRFLDHVATELNAAGTGTVTVRVLPPGRAAMATILCSTDADTRRVEIGPDGRPVDTYAAP